MQSSGVDDSALFFYCKTFTNIPVMIVFCSGNLYQRDNCVLICWADQVLEFFQCIVVCGLFYLLPYHIMHGAIL